MPDIAEQDLQITIQAWDQGAWSLAALALAAHGEGQPGCGRAAPGLGAGQWPRLRLGCAGRRGPAGTGARECTGRGTHGPVHAANDG